MCSLGSQTGQTVNALCTPGRNSPLLLRLVARRRLGEATSPITEAIVEHSHEHRDEGVLRRATAEEHGPEAEAVDVARRARSSDVGHDEHAGHSVEMFRDRFWISLALTIPALIWDPMIQDWFGYRAPVFPGSHYVSAVFGTAVFIYGGRVFLEGAARELADRLPGMRTLIGLAISVAFLYSAAVTLGLPGYPLWWELATLVTIMLLGHWIEMRSIFQAQGALKELAKLLPDRALRITGGEETEEIAVDEMRDGDLILIRPG